MTEADANLDDRQEKAGTKAKQRSTHRLLEILACVIWIIGFFVSFACKPGTPWVALPDTLLLLGFIPILFVFHRWWWWTSFGVLTAFMGMVLEVTKHLPDNSLPQVVWPVKHHLSEMHISIIWILFGMLTFAYGLVFLMVSMIKLAVKLVKNLQQAKSKE
jgi:hypothetical protein